MKKLFLILCVNLISSLSVDEISEKFEEEKKLFIAEYKNLFSNENILEESFLNEESLQSIKKVILQKYLKSRKKLKKMVASAKSGLNGKSISASSVGTIGIMSLISLVSPFFFIFPVSSFTKNKKLNSKKLIDLKQKLEDSELNFSTIKSQIYKVINNYLKNKENLDFDEKKEIVKILEKLRNKAKVKYLENTKQALQNQIQRTQQLER